MTVYIGIDVGGTKIAAAAVEMNTGEVAGRTVISAEAQAPPAEVIEQIAELVGRVRLSAGLPPEAIAGLGVGLPGAIDMERGRAVFLGNFRDGWRDVPVAAMLERLTGYPAWLINDGSAFTLAEAILGAGRGTPTMVAFTIGTGIGGGIVINGKLHLGLGGTAGELGHLIIDPNGPLCVCGSRGCLEVFASGRAIAAMGVSAVIQRLTTQIGQLAGHDLNRITSATVMQAAEAGDAVARDILDRAGKYLGLGIANCANIVCPDRVIIGGGASQLGEWLLAPAREVVRQHCRVVPTERMQIVLSELGNKAGIVGAAVWASQQAH